MDKLLLLDGHSILARAFYAVPTLTSPDGTHTNAVAGFLSILFKFLNEEKPRYIAAAFDLDRRKLIRTRKYPAYKGTRKPMPEELKEQVPLIQEILSAMGVPVMTLEGYEADDILGTVAKKAAANGLCVTILSGDRDLLQLSDTHILISIPKTFSGRSEVFNYQPEDVFREYQVTPSEFIDLKALMGDNSDNIPGLPGVGPKIATDIIVRFHSIENAHEHVDEIKPPRAQKAMREHYDLAVLSKDLATINTDSPINVDFMGGLTSRIYTHKALELMRSLGLKTLSTRFARFDSPEADEAGDDYKEDQIFDIDKLKSVTDPFMADVIFSDIEEEKVIGLWSYAHEDDSGSHSQEIIVGVALNKDRFYVINSGQDYPAERLKKDIEDAINKRIDLGLITATLGLKEQLKFIDIPRNDYVKDVSIAAYLLDPNKNSHDYDDISRDILFATLEGTKELLGKKSLLDALKEGNKNALKLSAYRSMVAYLSYEKLMERLKKAGMLDLFNNIEMPLVYSLSHMEKAGIAVDRKSLLAYADFLKREIDLLTAEIYELSGEMFNINSPNQLSAILFEKLGIAGVKKTKKGYSTAADVLEKVSDQHPIVPKILRYRALTKLYSTYAYGLTEYISPDGRIHGTFNQTITATGRISSTDPNLQNIPVRTKEGKEIRKVFVPRDGYIFVDADYSQVELRILAALSGDETLINAYKNAVDIHALTASEVFHVPLDEVTPEMRRNAKAVNFGIVYGISAFGLGEGLFITPKEAVEYIKQYFKSYPKVKEYLNRSVLRAKENGFVTTAFGRVRPIPELKSSNYATRNFGERIAMNSPIQGTAADIMKIAMNRVDIGLSGMKSWIVLQVHDELLLETFPEELEEVKKLLRDAMENASNLSVPLLVDIRTGYSWYECH